MSQARVTNAVAPERAQSLRAHLTPIESGRLMLDEDTTTAVRHSGSLRELLGDLLVPADEIADDVIHAQIDVAEIRLRGEDLELQLERILGPVEDWGESLAFTMRDADLVEAEQHRLDAHLEERQRLLAERRRRGWGDDGWTEQHDAWLRATELRILREDQGCPSWLVAFHARCRAMNLRIEPHEYSDPAIAAQLDALIAKYERIADGTVLDETEIARARRYAVHACRRSRRDHEQRALAREALATARCVGDRRAVPQRPMVRRPAMRARRARVHRAAAARATADPDPEPSRLAVRSAGGAS